MKKIPRVACFVPAIIFFVLFFITIRLVAGETILSDSFGSYVDDAALDAAWPKVGNAISHLADDPENASISTLFSKGDRRHRTFEPVTPTDDEPLYVRVEYHDGYEIGVGGRDYIGLWATPTDHGNRLIEVGLHNHGSNTSVYNARVAGSAHGFSWFDLNTQRSAGWRTIELWVYADSASIYFDETLDSVVGWAGGELGAVRLGFGFGDENTASHTGVHYKNLLIEKRKAYPIYQTAFDQSEGFTLGSLDNQDGWSVDQGAASVIVEGSGQAVELEPATPRTRISRDFTRFVDEPVVFVDFSVRGGAGQPPSNAPEASSPETFHVAIAAEGDVGRFYVFDGDGAGSGTWVATTATVPIDANNELLDWAVVTVRLDYTRQSFDLYVDEIIAGHSFNFMFDNLPDFSRFTLSGNPGMEFLLDDFYAAPVPVFSGWSNQARDGIGDLWKEWHGFNLTSDIRDQDPYFEGVTNIARFFHQTGFEMEPAGTAVIFHDDFESGTLANWTESSSGSSLAISSAQNRTARGEYSALMSNSSQKMTRDLGVSLDGEMSVSFWAYDDMGDQTRWYGEARMGFQQIFAIGRYHVPFGTGTGTVAGESPNPQFYQGRVLAGDNAGWFNLNAPGAPKRSPGWRKFEIRRLGDRTTVEFYVDGILARTIADASVVSIQSVTIGAGAGGSSGNAWFDDVRVEQTIFPYLLSQPSSAIRYSGGSVSFHAPATGNVQSRQWYLNGQPISGATSASLTRSNLSPADAGEYRLAVTNAVGTTWSDPAYLAVIVEEPAHQTVAPGDPVGLQADAGDHSFLTYQWLKAGVPLVNGPRVFGADTPALTIADVRRDDHGPYSVMLSVPGAERETRAGMLGVTGNVVFNDDFSSGNLSNWSQIPAATSLSISSLLEGPLGGQYTAHLTTSRNKMYRNLGTDVGGHARAVFWIYDDGASPGVRWFGEVRAYQTNGFSANDKVDQVFAIGKYHVGFGGGTGMLAGEVMNPNKYQGRVAFGTHTGWFNLDAPGSPDVSVGWRKFEIERMPDGTTINFYVDGILSRTITDADYAEWDVVVMGSIGHFGDEPISHDAWFGGVTVEYFDSPLEEGLRGHWTLTDGSGPTAADSSGYDNHGALSSTGVDWRFDDFGIVLDGTGEVFAGNPPDGSLDFGEDSLTLTAWFRTGENGWQTFLSKGAYGFDPGYRVGMFDGRVFATIGGETEELHLKTVGSFNDGKWHRVVAVFDRDSHQAWIAIDGVRQPISDVLGGTVINGDTLDFSGTSTPIASNNLDFLIGAIVDPVGNPADRMTGDLADIRIHNRPLTEAEADLLHATDTSGSGIPDWWKLHWFGHLEYSAGDNAPGDVGITITKAYALGRNPNVAAIAEEPETIDGDVGLTVYTILR